MSVKPRGSFGGVSQTRTMSRATSRAEVEAAVSGVFDEAFALAVYRAPSSTSLSMGCSRWPTSTRATQSELTCNTHRNAQSSPRGVRPRAWRRQLVCLSVGQGVSRLKKLETLSQKPPS